MKKILFVGILLAMGCSEEITPVSTVTEPPKPQAVPAYTFNTKKMAVIVKGDMHISIPHGYLQYPVKVYITQNGEKDSVTIIGSVSP